jgi:hypothetical protein
MFFFQLLLSSALAQSSVDKNIEYLRKMVKKGKCGKQISGKVDSYVERNMDYPLVWKLRAEADVCLKKSDVEVYSSYEKFLELGGKKSEVVDEMAALESVLYQVEIDIQSIDGSKLNWSQIDVSLPSDRFSKISKGKYILKYTTAQAYELTIKSSDPSVESLTKTLEGTGNNKVDIKLDIFEFSDLTIPKFEKGISLKLYPSNNSQQAIKGRTGTKTIAAGPLKVEATYINTTIDYTIDINAGPHILSLPWGYQLQHNETTLVAEFLSPEEDSATFTIDPIPFDIKPLELPNLTYNITKQPGFVKVIDLQQAYEESDLAQQVYRHNNLVKKHTMAKNRVRSSMVITGAAFGVGGILQALALESNNSSLRSASNGLLGVGALLMVYTFDVNKSSNSKMKKEIKASEQKLEDLKKDPIIIR